MKTIFTTGQVAKICKVAPRTVSKWFDSGRLKGYRIPGSQDRRIPREYLIKFLKEHGMPLGDLEDEAMAKVLIVAQDQVLIENLKRELPPEKSFKVAVAASGFEAGIQAESFNPDCIIVDFSIGKVEAVQICQNLRIDVGNNEVKSSLGTEHVLHARRFPEITSGRKGLRKNIVTKSFHNFGFT